MEENKEKQIGIAKKLAIVTIVATNTVFLNANIPDKPHPDFSKQHRYEKQKQQQNPQENENNVNHPSTIEPENIKKSVIPIREIFIKDEIRNLRDKD